MRNDEDGTLNGSLTTGALVVNRTVGIGTANPQTSLEINGAIKLGSEDECDESHAGSLRYLAGALELCNGVEWVKVLTTDDPPGCTMEPLVVDDIEVPHARLLSCRDQDPIRIQILECGNGTIDTNETCDDGNFANDDGCNNRCQLECGDGVVGANEQCDDGNTIDTDGCTSTCLNATCGDGIIQDTVEECDGGQDCLPDCTKPPCAKTGGCPTLEFVPITGGIFSMGYEGGAPNELPVRNVTVGDFEILKNEVTVAQYKLCVDAGVCSEPKQGELELNWDRDDRTNYPVNGVSWHQAKQFANWVGADLPSEAQWEYAAKSSGEDQALSMG